MGHLIDQFVSKMEMADDMVEEIVKRLPLECLLRFRIVCKGWNSLLRQLCADAANKQPDLLISLPNPKQGCFIYSFLTRQWRPLFFSFISAPECTISGCGDGLLLLDIPAMAAASWVCDPFTGTSFPLPPLKSPLNVLRRWVVQGQNRGTFKVLLLGKKCSEEEEEAIQVQEYDSVLNSWNEMGGFYDLGKNCRRGKSGETAYCNGFVYVMGRDSVAVFDSREGRWSRVGIPAGAAVRNNVWPRLLSCGRSVVVVRLMKRGHVLEEVIRWEVCEGNGEWKEVGRMPEWARGKLQRRWIECVGVGENVCFRSGGSGEIVVYSLGEGSWHCLPKCPAAFINDSRVRGLAFQQIYSFPPHQPIS